MKININSSTVKTYFGITQTVHTNQIITVHVTVNIRHIIFFHFNYFKKVDLGLGQFYSINRMLMITLNDFRCTFIMSLGI